jgi:glycerol dehydrogenase-like iron-containing ADH family enzyme
MLMADTVETLDVAALRAALGQRSVVLVGMMGSGKSSVGKRLGARLGLPSAARPSSATASAASSPASWRPARLWCWRPAAAPI